MVYEFYEMLDPLLIFPFRLLDPPFLGYLLGNLYLAFICAVLGELTLSLMCAINGGYLREQHREMMRHQSLSVRALIHKDKSAYKAANKLANDAFGKSFFNGIALFSSSLWPVPFALGWLGFRFSHLDFDLLFSLPLLGDTLKYPAVFLLLYILARILTAQIRKALFGDRAQKVTAKDEQWYTWADLHDSRNIRSSDTQQSQSSQVG